MRKHNYSRSTKKVPSLIGIKENDGGREFNYDIA
jgi:hypothetical protein